MTNKKGIDHFNDYELLNWIFEQEFYWREELYKMSGTVTLQGLVDYVRDNFKQIKELEKNKRYREGIL